MKAVIFDLGRVLVEYDHGRTLTSVAAACACDEGELRRYFAEAGSALRAGDTNAHHLYDILIEEELLEAPYDDFLDRFCAGIARNDQALAYAVDLQQRPDTTVAVISNTNDGHVLWLDEHVPELREFDLVIMSNEVGMAKPDAAIYKLALELLDLPAHQAIFIDDLEPNVRAAESLGMTGIVHADWRETRPALEAWLMTAESAGDLHNPR